MFDKWLCKRIQKKEITIGDIFSEYAVTVFWLIIACFSIFVIVKMLSAVFNLSYLETIKMLCKELIYVIIFCVITVSCILAAILFTTIIFDICLKISKVKVATCPNVKSDSKEPSQDKVTSGDINPKCALSNVCELGKTCTNCYNDCLKKS